MWTDTTSYSQSDKERKQTSWTYDKMRISVVKGHRDYPDQWVMHCYPVGIDTLKMNIPDDWTPEQAQDMAIRLVRAKLNSLLDLLPN